MIKSLKYVEEYFVNCWYKNRKYEILQLHNQEKDQLGLKLNAKTQKLAKDLITIDKTIIKKSIISYCVKHNCLLSSKEEHLLIEKFIHLENKLFSRLLKLPLDQIFKNVLYIVSKATLYFENLSHSQYSDEIKNKLWSVCFENYGHVYEFDYVDNHIHITLNLDLNGYFSIRGYCPSTNKTVISYGLNCDLPEYVDLSRGEL